MKQVSWASVFAESEEQFEQLFDEMVNTCKSYGYDAYVAEKIEHVHAQFDACGIAYEK